MSSKSYQNGQQIKKDIQLRFETFGKGTLDICGNEIDIDPADTENPERRIKEIILQTFISDFGGERITKVYVKNSGSRSFDYKGSIKDVMRELFVNSSGFVRPKSMFVQDFMHKKGDKEILYGEKFFSSLRKYCERHNIPYNAPL